MPRIEVDDGVELYYEDLGSGDKYMLSLMMDFPPECTTRALAEQGYHVLCITNRGIGKSTHVHENYGTKWFDIFADDVVKVADKLGIDKFTYIGCSHGAGTGWHIALRHPERLNAFIAMVGGPHNNDEGTWSFRTMGDKAPIRKSPDPAEYEDEAIVRRIQRNAPYYKELRENVTPEEKALDYKRPLLDLGSEANVQEFLKTIQVPMLMLGGMEDSISRPDLMMRTAACVPHCKLVMYSGLGHSGPFSQIIEESVEEILNFMRNVEKNGRVYKQIIEP